MEKPAVENKRKPPAARKSFFEGTVESSQKEINNKTQEVSKVIGINCLNYKDQTDKLLKQKTMQQISINKLEETINKMQTNINNLHENITKMKSDNEIIKSKMFSYENIGQNNEIFKSTTGLKKLMILRLNFLTQVLVLTISNFMMVKITRSLEVAPKMLNLEKWQSAEQSSSFFYVLKLVEKWFYYKNVFLAI